jgi:AcrR family transcriptional regulator
MTVKGGAQTSVRFAQAAQTRLRILDAAAHVFELQGFAGARIEDIATGAGVAVPTVYKVFTNKRNVLVAAVARAMAGNDDDRGLDEQSWFTEQLKAPDPARQLALIARNARRVYERSGSLLEVLQAATPLDPELSAEWLAITGQRLERSQQTAASIIAKAPDAVRLSRAELAATLVTLTAPGVFAEHRAIGRTGAAYEKWLTDVLQRTILNDVPSRAKGYGRRP